MVSRIYWTHSGRRIIFLLLPGFDETVLARATERLGGLGVAVVTLGGSRLGTRSRSGRRVAVDGVVGDAAGGAALVVLGDGGAAGSVATDPRFGRFIHAFRRRSGMVITTPSAALALAQSSPSDAGGALVIWRGDDAASLLALLAPALADAGA